MPVGHGDATFIKAAVYTYAILVGLYNYNLVRPEDSLEWIHPACPDGGTCKSPIRLKTPRGPDNKQGPPRLQRTSCAVN